uniref:Metalloendopeptidase n=1 Tax=Panagrellus redivivus TaxID=6233 RepID=A0A7E4W1J7_PANRE
MRKCIDVSPALTSCRSVSFEYKTDIRQPVHPSDTTMALFQSILVLVLCQLAISQDDVLFDSANMDPKATQIYDALIPSFEGKEGVDSFFTGLIQLGELQRQLLGVRDHPLRESPRKRFRSFLGRENPPMQAPYLFQGDLILTKDQMNGLISSARQEVAEKAGVPVEERAKRALIPHMHRRWNQFPIPYTVDEDVDLAVVQAGLAQWSDNTCISFEHKKFITRGIKFVYSHGCFSSLGMTGGVQTISIGRGCGLAGIVAHEVGHALGLHHEQARYDRDDYVRVLFENIDDGMYSAFVKHKPFDMVTHGVGYDYGSIMHYEATAFSRGFFDESETISTKDPNFIDTIGQREALSFKDIKKVNFGYCNSTCSTKLDCQNGGYIDPKNCSACKCPDGFGDRICDKLIRSERYCGDQVHYARHNEKTLAQYGDGNCYYIIKAPRGYKIKLNIDTVHFNKWTACADEYVEIRYGTDLGATGARLCKNKIIKEEQISKTNKVIVIYRAKRRTRNFSIRYSLTKKSF